MANDPGFLQVTAARLISWRTPAAIVVCGCLIAVLNYGPRSSLGFFLTPISTSHEWGREVFALALAIQNLTYGISTPFAGGIADRFGTVRVLVAGSILYAAGLVAMAYSTTPGAIYLSCGLLIGFGISGTSFTIVIAALGKLMPEKWRSLAFGGGTAAGSFGQFLFSPLGVSLIDGIGWQPALLSYAGLVLLVIPLSLMLMTPAMETAAPGSRATAETQSFRHALAEACAHRSYLLLVLGFFTCGFQLSFITVHLPSYLLDLGLSAKVGGWTLAIIGLFNIAGSMTSGWLGTRMPKRYILSFIYFTRAIAVVVFISTPASVASALIFGAVTGFLWLSTVPPTSGLVAVMFGTRWLGMLFGVAFFSHQVGGFLGIWLGGLLYEHTGSYNLVWWLSVLFGLLSAVINLPIVEKPVTRVFRRQPKSLCRIVTTAEEL
jgi:MFS family permease